MIRGLLDLPVEIRLVIYQYLFGSGQAVLDNGSQSENPTFVPNETAIIGGQPRSSQMLRTCRTVWAEAQPLLYSSTRFVAINQAFAGKLPQAFSDGNVIAHQMQNLVWQLSCDFMKHLYIDDVHISADDVANVQSLELRCQAENWKESFCGAWTDKQAIVRGREDIISYAQQIRKLMKVKTSSEIFMVEDASQTARGKLILRIQRAMPASHESLVEV